MLHDVPSWMITLVLTILFGLGLAGGWRLYGTLRRHRANEGGTAGAGYIVSAMLGLLSLLIGFTLALSLDRYEVRRRLVVDEAGAISTTWLRDQLLDEPFRSRLNALLRDYIRDRSTLASVGMSPAALDAADHRAEARQQLIWRETVAALRAPDAAALTTTVLQATNDMFDLPGARRAALDAAVPPLVMWTLVVVALIASVLTGYGLAVGRHRHRLASGGVFLSVAITITLIFELDEPRDGIIRVPQTPLERVAATILSTPAASDVILSSQPATSVRGARKEARGTVP